MACTVRPASMVATGFMGAPPPIGGLIGRPPSFCTPRDLAWAFLNTTRPRRPPIRRRYTIPQREVSQSPSSSVAPSRDSSPISFTPTPTASLPLVQESVHIRLTPRPAEPGSEDLDSIECSHTYHIIFSLRISEFRAARCFRTVRGRYFLFLTVPEVLNANVLNRE